VAYWRTGERGTSDRSCEAAVASGSRWVGSGDDRSYLVPLLDPRQKLVFAGLAGAWLVALVYFWQWWLAPEHNFGTVRFAITTLVLGWITLLPLYFVAIFCNGRVFDRSIPLPPDLRVAMVVTKAPSEPSQVVRDTLRAMLGQAYPHDTWLADEDPSDEMIAWCEQHGVMISTRKGRADYHRTTWPRRTRCKEGNLAFFYDHYGYDNYDLVVQLDADHVPQPGYLEEMLRPFADPQVGYVSAPSICDKNAGESWSARGRLYVEGSLHGPLQAGYTGGLAPLCIGSHYAVRTRALKQIGGLGPELAEDHSTTLMMNAHGWRGVHALDAIATGDGPATFADFATQEFQWSRSLMTILLNHTPRFIWMLPWRLRFQFVFCQLWYPLFCLIMLAMFVLPLAALFLDANMVGVTFPEFFVRFALISILLIVMAFWWRAQGWTRPVDAKILGWEGMLFPFARWPWAFLGILAAVWDRVSGTTADFRVTPKGTEAAAPLPAKVLVPYAALAILSGAPVLLLDVEVARGFYVFAAVNAALYAILLLVIVVQHARENPVKRQAVPEGRSPATPRLAAVVMVAVVLGFAAVGADQRLRDGASALLWGVDCLFEECRDQTAHARSSDDQPTFSYKRQQGG
jgi:cellulose synthase (UDP-forming)